MSDGTLSAGDNTILIFGASGDLTARKLIPALFKLSRQGYLNERSPVIGVARRDKSDEQFRQELAGTVIGDKADGETTAAWEAFCRQLFY